MEISSLTILILTLLFVLLGIGFWVGFALVAVAWFGLAAFTSAPSASIIASTFYSSIESWPLAALPLFIWMGEILGRTRLSGELFRGLAPWMQALPGRLLHVNIFACGIFAAVSGSSAATTLTIGRIALPELERRGYDPLRAVGSLSGAGTLGLMIPPSIPMIVYGVAAGVSVTDLFIAGLLPGLLLILLFSGYLVVWALLNPDRMPPADAPIDFVSKFRDSRHILPVLLLIAIVIGSMYGGFATPTEAATLGVVGAFTLLAVSGGLTWDDFSESLSSATKLTCMIGLIVAGAGCISVALGFLGVPRAVAQWVATMDLSTFALLAALSLVYFILGCFLEGVAMILLTLPILMPVIKAAGIDPLWFGIYLILVIEIAQLTPPVGFNLFVIQALTNRDIGFVVRASLPMVALILAAIVLISLFPEIATWLPGIL